MSLIKKVAAFMFALVLAFQLCGCSQFGAPATTEELLVRYVANENVENYKATVEVGLSVQALGVRATMPITVNARTAGNVSHGTIEVDLSSLKTRNYKMEFYSELLDNVLNCYIGTPGTERTTWKLWQVHMTAKIDIRTLTDLLSSSELTLIAKDSDQATCYELTAPTKNALETAFALSVEPAEVAGLNEQDLLRVVDNDKVRVGFDRDCLLRSVNTSALATVKNAETNNVEVRASVEVSATLDDYGKTDPAEVTIPDEVRQAAVPTDTPVDVLDVIGADSPLAGAVGSK